jgi:hypothetical protein
MSTNGLLKTIESVTSPARKKIKVMLRGIKAY